MTELGFRVTDVSLQAGELARIGVVVPRDEPRSVFVQLVLLERKLKRVDFQIGAPDPRVVAEVPVAAGASSVELPVPHDLPPAYDGETIAWSYELRLLNDWRRPDDRCRLTVDVAPPWSGSRPSVPTRALGEPASSRPLEISKLVREPGSEKGSTFGLALVMLGGAGGFGWFGFTRGDDTTGQVIFLVLALIALGVGLLALYTVFLDPGRHMDTVRVSVRQPVVGAGESIEVDVDPGEMTDLVARLRCVEMAVWQRKRTNSAGVAYDTADCDVVDIAAGPQRPGDVADSGDSTAHLPRLRDRSVLAGGGGCTEVEDRAGRDSRGCGSLVSAFRFGEPPGPTPIGDTVTAAVQQVHRRYQAYAGFVTTPQYFDDSPQQFLQVAPPGTGILQRVNHIPDYEYELEERASNFSLLEESAVCLGRSFCQVVGQVGSNWVHCNGTSPTDIERICDDISNKAGARFFMAGHCLVEGLRAIGARTVTVVNGYYRRDWSAGINGYLEAAGFEILWAGDLVDQGLVADEAEKLAIEAETLWDYPNHLMIAASLDAHQRAPEADAIVQTGAGFRMLQVVDTIEGQTGTPVVASDFALYWAMLRELSLPAAPGSGSLLATLGGDR